MEASVWMTPPAPALVEAPVELMTRAEPTALVLLPLKRLLVSTPLREKLLEVSRWPLAQMGWLPRPESAPVPPGSSMLTPGDWVASTVKLPVASGARSEERRVG